MCFFFSVNFIVRLVVDKYKYRYDLRVLINSTADVILGSFRFVIEIHKVTFKYFNKNIFITVTDVENVLGNIYIKKKKTIIWCD